MNQVQTSGGGILMLNNVAQTVFPPLVVAPILEVVKIQTHKLKKQMKKEQKPQDQILNDILYAIYWKTFSKEQGEWIMRAIRDGMFDQDDPTFIAGCICDKLGIEYRYNRKEIATVIKNYQDIVDEKTRTSQ